MDVTLFDAIETGSAKTFRGSMPASGDFSIRVNCPGGDVFEGLAIYNAIRQHKGKVTAIVEGLAASMATVVLMACDSIVMQESSMLMIHNPWAATQGDAAALRKHADLLEKTQSELVDIYAKRTGRPATEVAGLLASETWLTASEAVEAGFADSVSNSPANKPRMSTKAISYLQELAIDAAQMSACAQRLSARQKAQQTIDALQHVAITEPAKNYLKDTNLMSKTPEQIRAGLLESMTTHNATATGCAHIYADNGNAVKDAMADALLARAGLAQAQDKQNPFRVMSLSDMARAALTERGVSLHGVANKMAMVGLSFTHSTSDFGHVLMDVANKAMLAGWEESGETFQQWTKAGTLTDFRTARRVGLSGFPVLPEVPEGAEYRYISTDDHGAPITLATYGGIFTITRQAIINDDLSAFSSIPEKLGRAASRTIGDLVYSVLTQNAKLPDSVPLFHADHGNLTANAEGLTPEVLAEARKKMRIQTDSKGHTLNIAPSFMIVPAALEAKAAQVLNSTAVPGTGSNSGIANPVHNMGQLIVEPRLDKADTGKWYLASAQGTDTIEVAYLDGASVPYIEQQEGFTVDGSAFKVRIDAGVAPLDYRGMARVDLASGG